MSTAPLEQFIKKYQTAKSYNSKEIRLTMHEAEEISTAIALLLASNTTYAEKIIMLQEQLLVQKNEVEMNGGGFT
jgi:hypothetical protein